MYFMLMVTSEISMHAIKPLKQLSTDKNIFIQCYAKMPLKIVHVSLFLKIKLKEENNSLFLLLVSASPHPSPPLKLEALLIGYLK